MRTVKCGEFVKRQIKESGFSHFIGTWVELEAMVTQRIIVTDDFINQGIHPGYRDGVLLIDMPAQLFQSAVVTLDENSKLMANYAPRRTGEASHIRISAKAEKQPAKYASVVIYSADVLAENNERETDADWEIVAIKARTSDEEEPMDPYTMARNFLHLEGGTKGNFTAEQFAKSIVYWNNHCMSSGSQPWHKRWLNKIKGN